MGTRGWGSPVLGEFTWKRPWAKHGVRASQATPCSGGAGQETLRAAVISGGWYHPAGTVAISAGVLGVRTWGGALASHEWRPGLRLTPCGHETAIDAG